MQVSRFKVDEVIKSSNGKIFSCEFIKKDGSLRKMVARLGVRKNLKGGANGESKHNSLVTVFDMIEKAYRMINLETIQAIKVSGTTYEVI
jgi:hypothetical protein